MSKITLNSLANLQNENTAVTTINANNATLVTALDNTLSRDGTLPNQMSSSIDMNSNRVINLGIPAGENDAVRLGDVQDLIAGITPNIIQIVESSATMFDIRNFGAVCNGIADDTIAIQAAINAAQAVKGTVHLFGSCKISSTLTATHNIKIIGDGMNNTWLFPTASTFDALFFNSADGVTLTEGVNSNFNDNATCSFEGFSIQYPTVQVQSKYAIKLQAQGSLITTQPVIRDIGIYNAPNGMLLYDVIGGVIERCVVMNFGTTGIELNSPDAVDGGGTVICHNSIVNYNNYPVNPPAGYGIYWQSPGGIKIIDNGFAVLGRGIYGNLNGSSSQMHIKGNTFDSLSDAGIYITRQNGSVTFSTILVEDNAFAVCPALYLAPDTSNWLDTVIFTGNIVNMNLVGSGVFFDGIINGLISGNIFRNYVATNVAINLAAHSSIVMYGPNLRCGSAFSANADAGTGNIVVAPT